jgi:hypothetical protein
MRQRIGVTSDQIGRSRAPRLARRLLAARKKLTLYELKGFAIIKSFALIGEFRQRELRLVRLSLPVPGLRRRAGMIALRAG